MFFAIDWDKTHFFKFFRLLGFHFLMSSYDFFALSTCYMKINFTFNFLILFITFYTQPEIIKANRAFRVFPIFILKNRHHFAIKNSLPLLFIFFRFFKIQTRDPLDTYEMSPYILFLILKVFENSFKLRAEKAFYRVIF